MKNSHTLIFKTENLTLSEGAKTNTRNAQGFYLYDQSRGMHLSMRAKTERAALVEALEYYQKRLTEVEATYKNLNSGVMEFVEKFTKDDDFSF